MRLLQSRAFRVLALSGAAGFWLGMVVYPNWQVAVEAAQVVAGLVHYPAGNPFYVYETKLWTILHQICALFLLSGVPEIALCKLLSGVMGMLSLQALAMGVFALSGNTWLAVGTSLFVLSTRSASNGVTYPILLMSTEHTYGSIGLSTLALSVTSLAAGCYPLGGFLLGVMPAVHPSWGIFLWTLVFACVVWDWPRARVEFRPALKGFASGVALTGVSLAVQLLVTYDVPRVDPAESAKYLDAFVSFWDGHRAPVNLTHFGVVINQGAFALGLIWLAGFRDRLSSGAVFLLRFMTLAAAVGLLMSCVSWVPPDRFPSFLVMLMPSRILNICGLMIVPMIVGLLAVQIDRPWARALLVFLLAGLLLSRRSMLWEWSVAAPFAWLQSGFDPLLIMEMTGVGLIAVAAADSVLRRTGAPTSPAAPGPARAIGMKAMAAAAGAFLVVSAFLTLRLWPDTTAYFRDRTNDPFFAAIAAEREGIVLLAGSYANVQLYTRRPVLLDGALDTLTYAPESGPAMQQILLDVYGVDLLNPPPDAFLKGVLPRWIHKDLWEQMSTERWSAIRGTYDVRVVVTPADWTLHLPVAADNGGFRLYRIPG